VDDNDDKPTLMAVIMPMPPGPVDGGDPLQALRVHARTTMLDDLKPPQSSFTFTVDGPTPTVVPFLPGIPTDTALDLPARVPWWRRVLGGLRWSRRDAWR